MTDNRNTILAAARANPGPDRTRQAVAADGAGIDHATTGLGAIRDHARRGCARRQP